METKRISIVLTKLHGRFSNFIYHVTGRRYTHASIRLDEMDECFYSFNFHGLCIERPSFFSKKRIERSILYQIEIPADIYDELEAQMQAVLARRRAYHYTRLGVCLCLLRIPHRFPDAFFCSQFVADFLIRAGVLELDKSASLYTPNALEQALCGSGLLRSIIREPVFA